MRIIKPYYTILTDISEGGLDELKMIERIARVCYKSEGKITPDGESAKILIKKLIDNGHEAMIEHSQLSVLFVCDRGVSHELVRHRIASFAQESTRYCNYMKEGKFPEGVTFISPCFYDDDPSRFEEWKAACEDCEYWYFQALKRGATPQEARTVLNNSVKTEIVVTANYREFRNIFKLRTSPAAHPQMRELMVPLLADLQSRIPIIFDDIEVTV